MNWNEKKNDITVLSNDEKLYIELLAKLVLVRKEKNITQAELGDLTGLKQSAIARIESQQGAMNVTSLLKMVDALGCELDIKIKS